MQTDEFKKQYQNTSIKNWGVDNPSKLKSIKSKISKGVKKNKTLKLLKRYPNIIKVDNNELIVNCNNCNCGKSKFKINRQLFIQRMNYDLNPCIFKNPIKNIGILENTITQFLDELGINYETHNRNILNGKELDIWIPDKNLAIEFNGVYWHSEIHKPKLYHQEKTLDCLNKGISLFHIWEDQWKYQKPIIKSMIKQKLGLVENRIGARKCQIKPITAKETRDFLNRNHLQGNISNKIRLGLWYNKELVSVMTLGKKRKVLNQKHKEGSFELYRFATKLGWQVQGGFSRLLKYFIRQYQPIEILTYASLDHSSGKVYKKVGFKQEEQTQPGYWWVVDGIRRHRYNFTKQKLIKEGEDPNLTEREIMTQRGYYRLWDSGNLKFRLDI